MMPALVPRPSNPDSVRYTSPMAVRSHDAGDPLVTESRQNISTNMPDLDGVGLTGRPDRPLSPDTISTQDNGVHGRYGDELHHNNHHDISTSRGTDEKLDERDATEMPRPSNMEEQVVDVDEENAERVGEQRQSQEALVNKETCNTETLQLDKSPPVTNLQPEQPSQHHKIEESDERVVCEDEVERDTGVKNPDGANEHDITIQFNIQSNADSMTLGARGHRTQAAQSPTPRQSGSPRGSSPSFQRSPSTPSRNRPFRTSLMQELSPNAYGKSPVWPAGSPPTGSFSSNRSRTRYSWQSAHDDEPNRPRIHIIKLFSDTVTASAAAPKGEAFGFSTSPSGRRIAVFNSARLYVIQTAALPEGISQDYSLKRRPIAVEFSDEGHDTMAILADQHTVNIYDSELSRLRRARTVKLDFPSNCIALAPTGGLLATGYEGGVEIFSLAADALPTDRRAVRSIRMDKLAFSADSSTLLGTTLRINASSSVVVSVPVFPAAANGIATHAELKEAWCSDLLHPENIRNSSHATFMREARGTKNDHLFAWNGLADTFGILSVADLQYGNIDFPVVISPPLSTCGGLGAAIHSCPAVNQQGDTVAMIVNERTVRLYIVPFKAEDDNTFIEAHSIDHELDEGYGCPFSEARWVHNSVSVPVPRGSQTTVRGRLLVASPGGVDTDMDDLTVEGVEGGRIILFDFDHQFSGQPGQTFNLILGKSPPQALEEEEVDVAEQIALARKRTVHQNKASDLSQRPVVLGKAAANFNNGKNIRAIDSSFHSNLANRPHTRISMASLGGSQSEATRSLPDLLEGVEEAAFLEEPYAQNMPRSQASLQRAATNAQRHRFQTLEERQQERINVERSGNNFIPLPEYSEEPNAPLPNRFRTLAGLDPPLQFKDRKPSLVTNGSGFESGSGRDDPLTAPPRIGEGFNADHALPAASATFTSTGNGSNTSTPSAFISHNVMGSFHQVPTGRDPALVTPVASSSRANPTVQNSHYDPLPDLPAFHPLLSPVSDMNSPSGTLQWTSNPGNVSPVEESASYYPPASTLVRYPDSTAARHHHLFSPSVERVTGESSVSDSSYNPSLHAVSPISPPQQQHSHSVASQAQPQYVNPPSSSTSAAVSQRPHTSASLFPTAQSPSHLPFRTPLGKASAAAHPVTAWRPPGANTSSRPDAASTSRASASLPNSHISPTRRPSTRTRNAAAPYERRRSGSYGRQNMRGTSVRLVNSKARSKSRKTAPLTDLHVIGAEDQGASQSPQEDAGSPDSKSRIDSKCSIM